MVLISEALKADCFFMALGLKLLLHYCPVNIYKFDPGFGSETTFKVTSSVGGLKGQTFSEGPDFFIQGVTEKEHKLLLKT